MIRHRVEVEPGFYMMVEGPAPNACIYVGDPVRGEYPCEHPKKPLGLIACSKRGCGPDCVGYKADSDAVTIDHGAGGIGDGLLGLLAVAKLKKENPDRHVAYRVSATAMPFVRLFSGWDTLSRSAKSHSEAPVDDGTQLNAGYQDENLNRYPVPRWERYAKNAGVTGFELPALRDVKSVRAAGANLAGRVVLCPFSTDRTREWSLHHWVTLESLLTAAGYQCVIMHGKDERANQLRSPKVTGQSAERVAGVVLGAVAVVGTDSGMAHLGGILGVPTIVLGGSTPVDRIFGAYRRVTCLQGKLDCSACCGGTGVAGVRYMDDRCQASCSNLQSVLPDRVLLEIDRVWLKDTLAAGRSLVSHDRLAVIRDEVLATNRLGGDVAELGVFRGGTARAIGHYAPDAAFHLFDTFEGIPETDAIPGGHKAGDFPADEKDVLAFLNNPRAVVHRGRFPEVLPPETRYRFVHLDADTFQSTVAGLEYFWPRLVPGGVIVLDDVDWRNCPGVRQALDSVLPGVEVEMPARHQGVVRK